jgi:hypothetical protein
VNREKWIPGRAGDDRAGKGRREIEDGSPIGPGMSGKGHSLIEEKMDSCLRRNDREDGSPLARG